MRSGYLYRRRLRLRVSLVCRGSRRARHAVRCSSRPRPAFLRSLGGIGGRHARLLASGGFLQSSSVELPATGRLALLHAPGRIGREGAALLARSASTRRNGVPSCCTVRRRRRATHTAGSSRTSGARCARARARSPCSRPRRSPPGEGRLRPRARAPPQRVGEEADHPDAARRCLGGEPDARCCGLKTAHSERVAGVREIRKGTDYCDIDLGAIAPPVRGRQPGPRESAAALDSAVNAARVGYPPRTISSTPRSRSGWPTT